MDVDQDSAGVRFPPPLIYIGTLIVGLAIDRFVGRPGLPLGWRIERGLGMLLIVGGLGVMLTAANLFRAAGTETRPWKTSTLLVTDRVYRWTRNPMYLGMALIYAGLALWFDSLVALLLLPGLVYFIQQEVIVREERYLDARFGDAYRDYKARVRRWF